MQRIHMQPILIYYPYNNNTLAAVDIIVASVGAFM